MPKHQLKETVLRSGKIITNSNDTIMITKNEDYRHLGPLNNSPSRNPNIIAEKQEIIYREAQDNYVYYSIVDTSDKVIRDFLFRVMSSAQKIL